MLSLILAATLSFQSPPGLLEPAREAVRQGDVAALETLLARGFEVNDRRFLLGQETLLHLAASHGQLECARLLLDSGADLDARHSREDGLIWKQSGITPLHDAAREGHLAVTDLLLERGADVEALTSGYHKGPGTTMIHSPLSEAALNGAADVVWRLLSAGAEVDGSAFARNRRAPTTAHHAVRGGDAETLRHLISRGARIDSLSRGTPLHWAAEYDRAEMAEVLLQAGADPDVRDDEGNTPLLMSARRGHLELVEVLCRYGANVNVSNRDGWTPLHGAVRGEDLFEPAGHLNVARFLLAHGADRDAKSRGPGQTALDLARQYEQPELVKLLED